MDELQGTAGDEPGSPLDQAQEAIAAYREWRARTFPRTPFPRPRPELADYYREAARG